MIDQEHILAPSLRTIAVIALAAISGIFSINKAVSQTYINEINELIPSLQYPVSEYAGGVSFVDWDGDGWDDITIARMGQTPIIFQNNGSGFYTTQPINEIVEGETKAVIWVDFDNDGDKDLFTTEYLGPSRLYENNSGELINVTLAAGFAPTEYETFGASWGDYDNDGFLDVYISNYDIEGDIQNQCYHNNGDGTFTDVTTELGIGNGSQTTFGSLWWDYDQNGWQDLFIGNDRDPFFNYQFYNQGGTFVENSNDVGLFESIWTMSTSAADYDNDGDLDIYLSNAWNGHRLYNQNEDGTFDNVAGESGIYDTNFAWAGQWLDYNLDGLQDLYICYEPILSSDGTNQMLVNTGEVFLYDNSMGLDTEETESHSSAVGDWNNDGVFDIFCYNEEPHLAQLWTSNDVEGTYLKVGLQGTFSNRDGIGSFITIWVNGEQQMRQTYCGEGFLTQNSSKEIFGLNGETTVDSLRIVWPSGTIDMLYDIESNQCVTVVENLASGINIQESEDVVICGEDELIYYLPDFVSYEWSNGSFGNSMIVNESMDVWVIAENANGQTYYSDTVSVVFYDEPIIDVSIMNPTCYGGSDGEISLENTFGTGVGFVTWESGQDTVAISNLSADWYHFTFTDELGCVAQDSVLIEDPEPMDIAVITSDVSCFGFNDGSFSYEVLSSQGEVIGVWDLNPDSLMAGEYSLVFSDSVDCLFETNISISEPEPLSGEVQIIQTETGFEVIYLHTGGTGPVTPLWSNGETEFLNANLEEGDQWVMLFDSLGCDFTIDFTLVFNSILDISISDPSLFPNPSDGRSLSIAFDKKFDKVNVRSLNGKLIDAIRLEKGILETKIYFSKKLAAGLYILEILQESNPVGAGQFSVK